MKCGLQYKVSRFAFKAIGILMATPGLTASQFAAVCWPHLHKATLLAAICLRHLIRQKLIIGKFRPFFWRRGGIQPRFRYFLTDKGYAIHEHFARIAQDNEARHVDRTGRPGDGAGYQRRA